MNLEPEAAHTPTRDSRAEGDVQSIEPEGSHSQHAVAEPGREQAQRGNHPNDRHRPPPTHDHHVQMNYHPLTLHGRHLTGLQIKEQAIKGRIPHIKIDFHLTVERAGSETEATIGDDETWAVRDGDCFTAVKPDDNS